MIKRELKINFKSFIIWSIILIALYTIVFLVYPVMLSDDNIKIINEMMASIPPEITKSFNMDIVSIDTVYGWFKTEGYIYVTLLIGLYAAILGSNILLKEESDNTIDFLLSKPVTRNDIVRSKVITGLVYVIGITSLLALFNFVGFELSGEYNRQEYLLLAFMPLLSILPIFLISLFISTFFNKTKKTMGLGIGFVLISYFLTIVASLSDKVSFIKCFSIYTLSENRYILNGDAFNNWYLGMAFVISIVLFFATMYRYNKKELN